MVGLDLKGHIHGRNILSEIQIEHKHFDCVEVCFLLHLKFYYRM